jgi:membrane associated rhomboid family serine protease
MRAETSDDLAFSRSAYPVFAIVAVLAAIHLLRQALDPFADFRLLAELAFVPAQFTLAFDHDAILRAAARAVAQKEMSSAEVAYLLGDGPRWWTWITYSLLHGGLAHLVMNSVWLLAFGTAVARRFGGARFVVFFIFTAVAGALAFYIAHPSGLTPVIGASAAISGAMGAAVRFAFSPGAPLGAGFARERSLDAYRQPAPSLRDVLQERRAITFLLLWFALNFIFGAVAPIGAEGPVAWEAHIGGFLAGFLGFALFDRAHDAASA